MKYEYESVTPGIFKFTIPGEHRTVELFIGSRVIVDQKLTGNYLRLLKLIREIPEEKPAETKPKPVPKKTSKPKAKVEDKITAVKVTEEKPSEKAEVKVEDTVAEVTEEAEKPAPKRRGRKKKTS